MSPHVSASDLTPPKLSGKTGSKVVGQKLLYGVSLFLSIGVWLFGFDQGVMSGLITNPYFKKFFNNPSASELGNMVAILEIGAFITSLLSAHLSDTKGRRFTLFLGACIFTVGGAIQTLTMGYTMMLVGRIISGSGVGLLSSVVPMYQSEISPADHRGKLACIEFTLNIVGYASSIWIDYFCSYIESDAAWRIPLSIQCIGGLILAIGALALPESPRYAINKDMDEEGLKILADFHNGDLDDPVTKEEFRIIKEAVIKDRLVPDRSYKALWTRYRSRVLIAMSSQAMAQMAGINVVSYYAPLVFEQAGWIGRDAILMTGINGLFYVASSIVPWFIVDTLGRRPILLTGAVIMAIALTATGWWIYIDQAITPKAVVVCIVVYNAAFGMSFGPIPWLYPPEIMPLPFRAKGVSLSTATNWFFNYIVGVMTPVLQELITWRLYPFHAGWCALAFVIVYFLFPETAGINLEDMGDLFGDEKVESDSDDDDDENDADGDEESSLYSGTPTSSRPGSRAGSRTRTTRQNSSSKLLENGNSKGMMKRMFDAMRGKNDVNYTELDGDRQ